MVMIIDPVAPYEVTPSPNINPSAKISSEPSQPQLPESDLEATKSPRSEPTV